MKKLLLTTLCISSLFYYFNTQAKPAQAKSTQAKPAQENPTQTKSTSTKPRKIVVLTSKGGNGHMATCSVLKDALPDCEIKLVYPIHDTFVRVLDGEEWYGTLLKHGWIRTTNFIARYPGEMIMRFKSSGIKRQIKKILEQEKPDLLISVIPLINYPAACAAERYGIPFMLITLDADLELWLSNMKKCRKHGFLKNNNFVITVQKKTPHIEHQLNRKCIPMSCIHEVGAPLRKDFYTPKDTNAIRKEWNIPAGKKVVMLMRGSTGSDKMIDYVKTLVKNDCSLHLLVCVGRNTQIIPKLNRIKTNERVTFSIVPFTPKIPDLMAISDLLVTQPTPNVCNEAMHMKLPILIDLTSTCLFWETPTIDWIKLRGCGKEFKDMDQLNNLVGEYINKKKTLNTKTCVPIPYFNTEIHKIVMGLIKKPDHK
jgi:UDP-N-acetylglucosamine:LPS N-acetylglucosamine transferase